MGGTDDHACEQSKHPWVCCPGHAHQAKAVDHSAQCDDAKRSKFVGHHARKNAHEAPGQVLDRHGKSELLSAPALGLGDGLKPQSKAVAYAHRQRDNRGAANQYLRQGEGFVLHAQTLTKDQGQGCHLGEDKA